MREVDMDVSRDSVPVYVDQSFVGRRYGVGQHVIRRWRTSPLFGHECPKPDALRNGQYALWKAESIALWDAFMRTWIDEINKTMTAERAVLPDE
jgi:hypothetical protein